MSAPLVLPSAGVVPELATRALPEDERVWVPQARDVWFRPLLLNTVTGGWCNLLRVRRSGVLHRHRHPMAVVGYVIKGRWRYRYRAIDKDGAPSACPSPSDVTRRRPSASSVLHCGVRETGSRG